MISKELYMKLIPLWVLTLAFASNAMAASNPSEIRLWTRGGGDFTDGGNPAPVNEKKISIPSLKLVQREMLDFQYGTKAFYRVANLTELIEKMAVIREATEAFPVSRGPQYFRSAYGELPTTWGEAVLNRISNQRPAWKALYPEGSQFTGVHGTTLGVKP